LVIVADLDKQREANTQNDDRVGVDKGNGKGSAGGLLDFKYAIFIANTYVE
jgi:hypothetical protein